MSFYFSYAGSKRKEIKEIIQLIDLNLYDNIIEPFGGSLSFSRYIYSINNKLNFYVSDINNELTYFCNNFYKNKDDIINKVIEKINILKNDKNLYNDYIKNYKNIEDEDFLTWFLILRTYYCLRIGLYPTKNRFPKYSNFNKKTLECDLFFKNINYECQDYKIYMDKFKNDEKSLIFLDPPYINSCNEFYSNQNISTKDINNQFDEIWEYLYNFMDTCKCKFILVVNDNFFMRQCYKKWFYKDYYKKYEMTKKETRHNIFTNINI